MRPSPIPIASLAAGLVASALLAPTARAETLPGPAQRTVTDGTTTFTVVTNPAGGPTLSFIAGGPVQLLKVKTSTATLAFKDMNANGTLEAWEDWRMPVAQRADALAEDLTIPQIAGLMLFSAHERAPEAGLTDAQRSYLKNDHLRNVLNAGANDVEANVTWVNEVQAFAEAQASTQP